MTTKLTDKNISNVANLGIQWQAVITADGSTTTTAVAGRGYLIDTTSNTHTINLPASAIAGDTIAIKDYAGTFGTNALTISRNGSNIQGVANDSLISSARASLELVYVNSTRGWVYTNESNVADLENKGYITATGGTVTTSGDYKIHTFTGDGCFVVSTAGFGATQYSDVDYLVVAGGGGGGGATGGGGGAGGYRESQNPVFAPVYTASPLISSTGITTTATTYPVTVGAGGAGGTGPSTGNPGANGSNSVFSTITSTGGGFGGGYNAPDGNSSGGPGGSGGGAGQEDCAPGSNITGSGNTPPTSPPQGNNGGGGSGGQGAGGGATAVGAPRIGGAGAGTNINTATGQPGPGPSRYYAGGGGAGCFFSPGGAGGIGGGGTGGTYPGAPLAGTPGTANTGGGGGGTIFGAGNAGAGGKGIVIIRYKFQN